jgi:trehalose 6-phosphate synthase
MSLSSRIRRALAGSARLRDSVVLIAAALISTCLIFGLLYDAFDGAVRRWTDRDLKRRAHLIGAVVQSYAQQAWPERLQRALDSLAGNDDVIGLLACGAGGARVGAAQIAGNFDCRSALALAASASNGQARGMIGSRKVLVTTHALGGEYRLFVVQDRAFLDARRKRVLQALCVAAELVLLALLVLARAGGRIGRRRTEEAARSVVRQMRSRDAAQASVPADLRLFARDIRDTLEQLRNQGPPSRGDGATRLREFVNAAIPDARLVVLANREPYAHEWGTDGTVIVRRPASGLVTGIEPMLRACGGTWIAHGSGSADRALSNHAGRLAVPPEAPQYTLRRVWIDDREYEQYYFGLANEGLWPLCHMAHAQPSFRPADWTSYQSVNEAFARAAVEETTAEALLLIQDYHFALAPRMIRNHAPQVVTSLFWHIPWPNSEVIGICPWKEALLEGMIGADIVGFQTRRYCLNFLETAQRYLECRVDLEDMSIACGGHRTLVRAYPISVEWPYPAASRAKGKELRHSLGISPDVHVSVGVDRADYTKGLIEKITAIELLLEENPSLIGRYALVQLASPTRMRIRKYQQLAEDLRDIVNRINERFATKFWKPVVLHTRTFSPDEVREFYAMADSALVTPLHDGMNLVAKEYAAACEDGDGVLVLSVFAGAAKELEGALLVNPYDTQQVAQAILRAVRMPITERRSRMQAMRKQIATSSIYDWSEKLLTDMCDVRQQSTGFWPQRVPVADRRQREVAG